MVDVLLHKDLDPVFFTQIQVAEKSRIHNTDKNSYLHRVGSDSFSAG